MSRSDRDRDDRGQYAETVTPGDVLALFQDREDPFEPLTAREVADTFDCDRKTAYNKLTALSDRDPSALKTKKIGARARVWWHSPPVDELARQVGEQRLDEIAGGETSKQAREEDIAPSGVSDAPAPGSSDAGTGDVETAIATADLPGSGDKLAARRDALRATVEYLREHGTATPADFRSDVYPEHSAGYTTGKAPARSWWKNAVYPGLRELADRTGVIGRADTSGEWTYERE